MNPTTMDKVFGAFFALVITIGTSVIIFLSGQHSGLVQGRRAVHLEAIKAGAAEWVPDKDGNPEIRWVAPTMKKERP